ncbi:MAG: RNA-binding protein [Methylococcaceae bacterium]
MLVFFRNIPPTTQKSDLVGVIKPVIKRRFFFDFFHRPGAIVNVMLLDLLDKKQNKVNVHGVVTILPDDVADLVIKQLDRKVINGRRITVRQYYIREEHNDPRKQTKPSQDVIDKRQGERRQHEIVSDTHSLDLVGSLLAQYNV